MDQKRINVLENMPVRKSVMTLVVPTVLSMLVQVFYNLTDTFFIGQLNDPYQVAAVTITMPIFMMIMAFSGIFGNGGASCLSRYLGKREYQKARNITSLSVFLVFIFSIISTIAGLFFLNSLVNAIGSSPHTYLYTKKYLMIIIAGSLPIMFSFSFAQLLRAEGAAKITLNGMIIGTVINVVLDPIFIFLFKMGVTGAAIATVIGNFFSVVYYIYYYQKGKSLAAPSIKSLVISKQYFKEIILIGFPSSISQIMMGVGSSISFTLASVYGDHAVAAMGIAQRVISIPIFTFIGLAVGIQPLIGYSYGAKNHQRLKESLYFSVFLGLSLATVFVTGFILFAKSTIILFIKDPTVIEYGTKVLRVFTFAIPFATLQMLFMTALQAMGKALPTFIVSISRQGLIYIPALYILDHFFHFNGLIWAMPITDLLTFILGFILFEISFLKTIRKSNLS